jgi:hypothetical protein
VGYPVPDREGAGDSVVRGETAGDDIAKSKHDPIKITRVAINAKTPIRTALALRSITLLLAGRAPSARQEVAPNPFRFHQVLKPSSPH